jgi:DNA-nicking Smr family endonuclease
VIEITDVFDLHTIPPKQVKAVVEEYSARSPCKGFPVVRIIHGKGLGVQRETCEECLERTDFVLEWTDAPPDAGGLGRDYREIGSVRKRSGLAGSLLNFRASSAGNLSLFLCG